MRNIKSRSGTVMLAVALSLLCFVLISTHMTSGLYAKYMSTGSGSDSARVIKFGELAITETGDFTTNSSGNREFVFAPGTTFTKDIKISFGGSEAATLIFVSVHAPDWKVNEDYNYTDLNKQLTWSVDSSKWTHLKSDSGTHVYYMVLEPNEKINNVPFVANEGEIAVNENGTVNMYLNYPATLFTVKTYAVQANGFESIADAWDSVSN